MRLGWVFLAALALSACSVVSQWWPHHHRHHPAHQAMYDADDFITELSSAALQLEQGAAVDDVGESLGIIEKYTAQKHVKPRQVTVAVLEYRSGAKTYKAIAPLGHEDFAPLSDILAVLEEGSYTLDDVRVVTITTVPHPPLKLKEMPSGAILDALETRQQAMLAGATKLAVFDEARQQIALLRFFLDHEQKEGAYLCADNAKRLLAAAARNRDIDEDNRLTQELDDLESRLRQEMPY